MRQISVELKIAALIIIAVAVVGLAGNFSYQSINKIVSALKIEAQPNMSLLLIKEINTSIIEAESKIKYFSLTGNYTYLQPYHKVKKSADDNIARLRKINLGNAHKLNQIDSINNLVQQKFNVWNNMLAIKSDDRLDLALSKLSVKLDSTNDTLTIKVPQNITIVKTDSVSIMEDDTLEDIQSKQGFFTRLFKKKEDQVSRYSIEEEPVPVLQEEIISKDTIIQVGIAPEVIHDEISKIRQEEGKEQQKITALEIRLSKESDEITVRLNQLIDRLEKEELEDLSKRAVEADNLANSTTRLSIVFLIVFSILLIGVFYVIQNYVRKSHATQKALVGAKDEALRLSRTREQFMANISHEIRTPMHAIVGFAEQLEEKLKDGDAAGQINIIKKSAEHLQGIINEVLDFSKLDAGKFELEKIPFSPVEMVKEAYDLYKARANVNEINYTLDYSEDIPDILLGDPLRLKQIVLNLLSNALKFTNKGFIRIKLLVHSINEDISNLIIKVSDSGIGISKQDQAFIFEEFNQAGASTSRQYGGTGLGLSIVKKLVEVQGGVIHLKSKPGEGTTFEIEIPYHIGGGHVELIQDEIKPIPELLPKLKLIVADDDEYNRGLLAHILTKWNIQFEMVDNGKKIINILDSGHAFDFVLLDIQMPEMNGIETASFIRNSGKDYAQIPLMALTATVAKEELIKCKESGINKIIAKPFKEGMLFKSICDLINIDISLQKAIPALEKDEEKEPLLFKNLYHIAGNDEEFVFEMLQMFLRTSKEELKHVNNALESRQWEALADHAHKLKSPCKHLDAQELSVLLKDIETKARSKDKKDQIYDMVKKSEIHINQLIIKVENFLELKKVNL